MALTLSTPSVLPGGLARWSDEARLTALLFVLSFLATGIPRLFTSTASHTLFLEQYGANAMPYAYLGQAIVVPIVGQLYLRAQARLGLRALMVGTLVADLIVLVLLRVGLALTDAPVVSLASIIWFEVEFALSGLVLWGLANQLMTLRQGKRLYGLVGAGEPVAIVLLGLFTPWLLTWVDAADLFLISALGVAAGVPLVLRLTHAVRFDGDRGTAAHAEAQPASGKQLWRNRYVLVMVSVVVASQMTYFLIDNAFYLEAADRYLDESELAGFLGLYNAAVGLISLATTMLVSGPFVHRFGVRAGLLVLPLLLIVGSTMVVVAGSNLGVGPILFWMVCANKLTDQSLRHTINATTSVVLYQPLPAMQRIRVQTALEIIVEPLIGGVAAVMLLLLMPLLKFDGVSLTYVILFFVAGWAMLVLFQHRLYLKALHGALLSHRLGSGRLNVDDEASRAVIRRGLLSARPEETIYCLRLLDDAGEPVGAHLVTLIDHAASEVRVEALHRLAREPIAAARPTIERRLAGETDPRVKAALLPALAAVGHDTIERLAGYLDDPDEMVRVGAFVALLRHGGIEGVLAAGEPFLAALRSPRAADRRFAALVLAEVGSQQWYRPLLALLTDDDEAVRTVARRAARTIRAPAVWSAIIDNLADPFDGRAAVTALAAIGDPILPLLDRGFDQAHEDPARAALVQRRIVAVWARLPSHPAGWRLIERLGFPDRAVRQAVLGALRQRRFQAPAAARPEVLDHLRAAAASAIWALGAWTDLDDLAGSIPVDLLRRALARQVEDDLGSIFTLLGFLYPPAAIEAATENYLYGNERRRAYALEILDNLLDREFKPLLLPLLEGRTLEQKLAGLSMRDRPARLSASLRLSDVLAQPAGRLTRWARGCAIYAGVRHLSSGSGDYFDPLSDDVGAGLNATPGTAVMMITIEKVLVLRTAGIFSAMQEEYLADVAERAREVELAAGETLFTEGDLGTSMYLVIRGRLRVHREGQTIAELSDGEVVGEMAAVDPEARSASLTALETSTLLCIDHRDIQVLLAEDPEVARGIIQVLCRRLRQSVAV